MTDVPEMTDLYRRLFNQLSAKFGGSVNEANADAIAYVAAELYHGEFEPHLWEEKSAHDVLDALGAPRAGVFAPLPLSDRLLALQKRLGTSESVRRGHELLTTLGVPSEDEDGTELTLRQRIDRFRSAEPLVAVAAAAPPLSGNGALKPAAGGGEGSGDGDGDGGGDGDGDGDGDGRGGAIDVDVAEAPGAAPLVEAVRALEEAARVEAEMTPMGGPAVDVAGLSENIAGLKEEISALRTLVESLATDLRERLEAVHEEVLTLTGKLEPTGGAPVILPAALEHTADLPPVPVPPTDPASGEPGGAAGPVDAVEDDSARRRPRRRLLLVVLLVFLGLVIAGLIVVTVVYGWDAVRDEMTGLVPAPGPGEVLRVLSTASPASPEGVVP